MKIDAILFRGKRADTGEWVEGYFCKYPNQFQNTSACSYPATSQPPITDACQISCQYDPVTDPERKKIHHNCQTEDSIQKDHTSSKMI